MDKAKAQSGVQQTIGMNLKSGNSFFALGAATTKISTKNGSGADTTTLM